MNKESYFRHVSVDEKVNDWQDSIVKASASLVASGCITQEYVNAMIENVKVNGSYIVIMPNVALPHSHSDKGVIKTGVSILKLKEPVLYPDNKPVQLIIAFGANDNEQHMAMLSMLADILMDDQKLEQIMSTDSSQTIQQFFFN